MEESKLFDIEIDEKYVETEYIKKIVNRAFLYLNAGFPVHLRGPAGVGKTALAFHIAKKISRPLLYMCGSEEFGSFDLIGGYYGSKKTLVVDNYISSVFKKEEEHKRLWIDGRLVTACKNGYTLIYDEFTRARPEINNVLLSVLEEKIVDTPNSTSTNSYMQIHKDFRILFTSNPEEYIGVYKSGNALIDRMITIDMGTMDEETEKMIIISKYNINPKDAEKIVKITRFIRNNSKEQNWLSMRCSIMLSRIIKNTKIKIDPNNNLFRQICKDVYNSPSIAMSIGSSEKDKFNKLVDRAINSLFEIPTI
jgi:nitric oxide reductase NorQ protein